MEARNIPEIFRAGQELLKLPFYNILVYSICECCESKLLRYRPPIVLLKTHLRIRRIRVMMMMMMIMINRPSKFF